MVHEAGEEHKPPVITSQEEHMISMVSRADWRWNLNFSSFFFGPHAAAEKGDVKYRRIDRSHSSCKHDLKLLVASWEETIAMQLTTFNFLLEPSKSIKIVLWILHAHIYIYIYIGNRACKDGLMVIGEPNLLPAWRHGLIVNLDRMI